MQYSQAMRLPKMNTSGARASEILTQSFRNGESVMPLITVSLIENVFSADEKTEMITKLTNTMVEIEGEAMRPVTWVKIEEIPEGQWGIGGNAMTAAMIHEMQKS